MKIEEGKYYRTREGKKVGPMERRSYYSSYSATSYPWGGPKGALYRENGKRYEWAGEPNTDLISEWKEEEPAMDYATMNEIVRYLREVRSAHVAEYDRLYAEQQRHFDEMRRIDVIIHQIESQYPKPDEEEK